MKRRDFIAAATAVGASVAVANNAAGQAFVVTEPVRSFIEIRTYRVKNEENKKILTDTIDAALIPALQRHAVGPVGAFTWYGEMQSNQVNDKSFENTVFVIIQHPNADSSVRQARVQNLLKDKTFVKDAEPILDVPFAKSVYETYESSLLLTFGGGWFEKPVKSDSRFYQLRCYKSFNIERNDAKIRMFTEGGELALFRQYGLQPVFFGETIFGQRMPNLTYMLGFETQEAHKQAWEKFQNSPKWNTLKKQPEYKETATSIVNLFLKPTKGSML